MPNNNGAATTNMSGFRKGFLLSANSRRSSSDTKKKYANSATMTTTTDLLHTTGTNVTSKTTTGAATETKLSRPKCQVNTSLPATSSNATTEPSVAGTTLNSMGVIKKSISSSSALLEFEHDRDNDSQQQPKPRNASSSLLFVSPSRDTRMEDEPSMAPWISGFGRTDEDPRDAHANDNHRDHDGESNDIGIQEVWSSKTMASSVQRSGIAPSRMGDGRHRTTLPGVATEREPLGDDNSFSWRNLPLHQHQPSPKLPVETNRDSVAPFDLTLDKEEEMLTSTSLANPNSLLLLSRELSKTLLRRNQYESFVATYLTSPEAWIYTWPLVLKRIPKDSRDLGTFMLLHKHTGRSRESQPGQSQSPQQSPLSTLIHVVLETKNQTRDDKILLLGAALLLNHVMKTNQLVQPSHDNDIHNQHGLQQDNQQLLLPLLLHWVQIVQESQPCRTVLAREAMLTAYGLVSHDTVDSPVSFHTLLHVQEHWLRMTNTKRDSWRRSCTLALIQDWDTLTTGTTRNNSISSSHSRLMEMQLCSGTTITLGGNGETITIHNFGGIQQTLFDTPKLHADTILLLLTEAKLSHPARRRSIVRGILAVLSQDKAMWQQPEFMDKAISELLRMLLAPAEEGNSDADSDHLCVSLLIILLEASLPERLDSHIAMIVDALREQPDKAPRVGLPWSTLLWESHLVAKDRYASVLESVCRTMFSAPDQMAPLSLFGSLVDGKCHSIDRIRSGVTSVLNSCSQHMQDNYKDMYQRLAPLLLIRRIPSVVYISLWQREESLDTELQDVITILATQMATRLNETSTDVSPSERKIVAEIVGRCLPFDLTSPYSGFTIVLLPAFQNLARAIQTGDGIAKNVYRPAKIALYSACCHVPLTTTSDAPPAILAVASFALWLLQPHNDDEELIECQLGCIEFFAACLMTDWNLTIAVGPTTITYWRGRP